MILEGKKAGAFVMCFDISKAAVSAGLARKLFLQSKYAGEAAGAACVLGHMYPALMHFRGGKGLACLGGVILAFGVHDFLTTLFLESVLLMATRYLCLVPITGSIFYPIYHGIERGGANVSGGQKQRLCIARALLKKPKILILDDSTSAVDTRTDALIREGFKSYIPETTKIIIAQRIASVENADMILVMDNGRVVDIGRHAELLERSPIYREVYEQQSRGGEQDEA